MITRVPKPPTMHTSVRKPATTGGKARAAQLPKGSASGKSSFCLASNQSTSSLARSTKPGGFRSSQGYNAGVPGSANRFSSPKVSGNGLGLSKTATVQHESKRFGAQGGKDSVKELYSPAGCKSGLTTGRAAE